MRHRAPSSQKRSQCPLIQLAPSWHGSEKNSDSQAIRIQDLEHYNLLKPQRGVRSSERVVCGGESSRGTRTAPVGPSATLHWRFHSFTYPKVNQIQLWFAWPELYKRLFLVQWPRLWNEMVEETNIHISVPFMQSPIHVYIEACFIGKYYLRNIL